MKKKNIKTIILFALIGFITLVLGSFLQKIIISAQINLKGFIVPSIYGTTVGTLLGFYILRSQKLYQKLKSQNIQLENSEAELRASNDQLTEHARKLRQLNVELVKAKEEAENSEKLKDDFIKNLNHEIRTPMNAIIGFASLMEKNQLRSIDYTKIIKQSSFELLKIIDSILEISLLNSNQLPSEFSNTNFQEIIQNIASEYQKAFADKDIAFEIINELNQDQEIIFTDPEKLQRILQLLTENALKFTLEGKVLLKISNHENGVNFSLIDSGVGIVNNDIDKIFNVFYTGCGLIQNGLKKGIGLGLSIAQNYAKLIGTQIQVESEVGKGSKFSFVIPSPEQKFPLINQEKKFEKIIYALDLDYEDYLYINTLCSITKRNFKIIQTTQLNEILLSCGYNSNIALIFINVEFTKDKAFEICTKIREKCKIVPIIALAKVAMANQITKAWKAGFDEFIVTPLSHKEFKDIMQKYN